MRFTRISLLVVLLIFSIDSEAGRLDSFSISQTHLSLRIRNFSAKQIAGWASHTVHLKVSTNALVFDLRSLSVDSVFINQSKQSFQHLGEKLHIQLGQVYSAPDSIEVKIHYRGTPAADPGGWGGFYFSGDYAFNLGVGFSVSPHSFGRAWFPCVDEFEMKSAYTFEIETDTNYTAACNGVLIGKTPVANGLIWHYRETVPMSAYLVSVSVSKFSILESTFSGLERSFPLALYCKGSDSFKVKASFAKLPDAIRAFEKAFGPQTYSKVGYNFVPFNAGAMEHAGNITYPMSFASGSADYEGLMAHELSHHWWGNNVTCRTEGDMWLNEGWASYCEHYYYQQIYGDSAYQASIANNHYRVLRFAHINDGQIFSLINIPSNNTYGNHVYKKGADVIHSLRSVLGDTVFFQACKAYQQAYRLGNASSLEMENIFVQHGGGAKAQSFFENWVYEKGSPHVIISKQVHSGNGPYGLKIHTLQKPRFTKVLYKNLPVEVFLFKDRKTYVKRLITVNQERDSFELTCPFKPVFVCLDYDEKLSDAITDETIISNQTGSFVLPEALCTLHVLKNKDSSLFRVEHHWVGPELYRTQAPYMSDYRYYSLDGIWSDSVELDLELTYDGRQGGPNANTGYLDHTLIYKTEDSLVVMYRAYPGDYWRVLSGVTFTYGSKIDKQGKVRIHKAQKGDYVLAMYDQSLGLQSNPFDGGKSWKIYPNPGRGHLNIEFFDGESGLIEVFNSGGQMVYSTVKSPNVNTFKINVQAFSDGVYTVKFNGQGKTYSEKVILNQ